jgi:hypothetical protein
MAARADSGERSRRKNNKKRSKKDVSKADREEVEFMIVQSGTARNAMEIIVGNPEWSDYIIEADLMNVGGRYAFFDVPLHLFIATPASTVTVAHHMHLSSLISSWGHPGVIFHAQDVNNYEVIYFRPHSFHSGT